MDDKTMWNWARDLAIEEYEEEYGYGEWDYVDKYEREDRVFSKYEMLKENFNTNTSKNKKENKVMTNKKEMRMETLKEAGINTGKFFNVTLPEGLQPGATIQLVINESGQPIMVPVNSNGIVQELDYMEEDPILNQIFENGYVRNTRGHRRWVMAQMFEALNYTYRDYRTKQIVYKGYSDYVNYVLPYKYQFSMTLEEIRVLSILEKEDKESFEERSSFFTKDTVIAMCEDYMTKLTEFINNSKTRYCKGTPYKTVQGTDIFTVDLNKKVYAPIRRKIAAIRNASNYTELYKALSRFMKGMVKLPSDTKKCHEWVDAYKGAGSYYTCKNLIMFHNCQVGVDDYVTKYDKRINYLTRKQSMNELKNRLTEYRGEGWKMHAFMKKLIEDNEFDFQAKMKEVYANK